MKKQGMHVARCLILILALLQVQLHSVAAEVDTVQTYSSSMHKQIKSVVILPDGYKSATKFPVLYLLHGYSGNYSDWVKKVPQVGRIADEMKMIIVCPDGNNSWYLDSPVDSNYKYETYIIKELIPWVDKNYKTLPQREGRAITGLSMGGHGALYLALSHQDIFGAAGSMSGGVDIRPFPLNWSLSNLLGKYADHKENWEDNTVINLVNLLVPRKMALIIDCGTEDFFYQVNLQLHEKLLYMNIPHDFITRPGAHNWEYWSNSIEYQALFMHRYFSSQTL